MNRVPISNGRTEIYLQSVSKYYGPNTVFRDLSFEIESGTVLAVIGPSGSGKTTLLNIIGLISPPSSGRILYIIDGKEYSDNNREINLRQYIGFSFQNPIFISSLNVTNNLIASILEETKPEQINRIKKDINCLLKKLGLNNIENRKPHRLSYGQKKRVDIARALIKRPKILILDEPTANLDRENADRVINVIEEAKDYIDIIIFSVNRDEKLMSISNKILDITKYK